MVQDILQLTFSLSIILTDPCLAFLTLTWYGWESGSPKTPITSHWNLNVNFYCHRHFTRQPASSSTIHYPTRNCPRFLSLVLTKDTFPVRDSLHFHFYALHLLFLFQPSAYSKEINFLPPANQIFYSMS